MDEVAESLAGVDEHLERGTAWLVLTIPTGYGRRIEQGRPTRVQVIADGSDASSVNVSLGYAANLVAAHVQELLDERRARLPSPDGTTVASDALPPATGGVSAVVRVWFNPELESRAFIIPGVLALVLLVMTTILAAMAIVREKELGTLEQLNVTPLRRWELVTGKLLPYALIGMIDVVLVMGVAVYWFEVPLRGSPALLLGLSLVYIMSTLGIGLFVSTISDTQQQAMMTAVFFFMMPMIYLSGFIFPIENMPAAIRPFTYLIPLRYYLVIVRGIFLKGIGLETLWPQALSLFSFGVGILSAAVWRSRKTAG